MARTPKARALGNALRDARNGVNLTLRDLGARIGKESGVLSRYETGDRKPKPEQVAQILTALGVNGERFDEIVALAFDTDAALWAATSLPEQRSQLAALVDCEQNATSITEVSPLLVPGLLQTSNYIRAIMSGGGVPTGEIATRVAIRIGRRDVITRQQPVSFLALIGEGVLHQMVKGREVMLEQLRYLLECGRKRNIDLRVVPHRSGWSPMLEGAFTLIESDKGMPVVQIENRRSGIFLHEEGDVAAYKEAVEMVVKKAATRQESKRIIAESIKRMER